MHGNVFTEITLIIGIAAIVAVVMRALRQPMIIGHIITGILVGPAVLKLLKSTETIELMGSFGIALLLFLVGLGLNPKVIKEVGRVSFLTGVGQVAFTVLAGLGLATVFNYNFVPALYIAIALSFSSTIIILKLITDKKEHNKLYGKISIGFLLVQDVIATLALVIASASADGGLSASSLLVLAGKGILLIAAVILTTKCAIKPLSKFLSRSQELLFLFAISWGFSVATLFNELGFSLEVGALIAGVALSTMSYAQEIGSRLRPLRDFFIIVFFISLGAGLNLSGISDIVPQVIVFSTLVLVGNPLIVISIMGLLGYSKKTGFKAGLAVAQISEFSLIFVLLGLKNGQISEQVVSLITVVAIVTIALSSYMITYSDQLYAFFERYLGVFERKIVVKEPRGRAGYDCILLGYRNGGSGFISAFESISKKYLVVDYNPEVIDELERKNIPSLYGDLSDQDLGDDLDLEKVKIIVSHISDFATNRLVVSNMQGHNPSAVVICRADSAHEAAELYGLGASYVILPHYIGTEKMSSFIRQKGFNKSEYSKYRQKHIEQLQGLIEAEDLAISS